jgi:hypothetical protein
MVAPPDRHLAVSGGCVRVLSSPSDNRHRPSADVLLRSVAEAFGTSGCGVVLSGARSTMPAASSLTRPLFRWDAWRSRAKASSGGHPVWVMRMPFACSITGMASSWARSPA